MEPSLTRMSSGKTASGGCCDASISYCGCLEASLKIILLKAVPQAIASGEDFKAGDVYGIAWQGDSPLYPTARRIDSMPTEEGEVLLNAIKIRQEAPSGVSLREISGGLNYLVSSYGVPIVWVTCDGTIHRTKVFHSTATAKHIEIAVKGILELSKKLSGIST